MNKINKLLTNLIFVCLLIAISGTYAFAQVRNPDDFPTVDAEKRPFDFADKYYIENGVEPSYIINRRSGEDGLSNFTDIIDGRFRGIRVFGTSPAYDSTGNAIFYTQNGELFDTSFNDDTDGEAARNLAERFPIYVFPSSNYAGKDRQAALFDTRNYMNEQNPIGLSVVVMVEYTAEFQSLERGAQKAMIEAYGESLDGTPIINTTNELDAMLRLGMITVRMKGLNTPSIPSYVIAPILNDPTDGAIAPDAFLMMVFQESGKVLPDEIQMLDAFECLQFSGMECPEEATAKR